MGKFKNLKIGCAISTFAQHQYYAERNFAWSVMSLINFIKLDQIYIEFDKFGQFSGMVMWANVSLEVSRRLLREGINNLELEDVNTGNETWLITILVLNGAVHQFLQTLRDKYLLNSSQVTYFRIKNGKRIAKRISRSDCTSFFRTTTKTFNVDNSFLDSHEGAGLRQAAIATQEAARTLGEVAMLARHVPEIGNLSAQDAVTRLERPGKLQQRRLYRDAGGCLCGYVAWAWLDSDLASQGIPAPQAFALHQWNEGPCLLICDAFATPTGLSKLCADLAVGLYPGEPMHFRPNASHDTTVPVSLISLKTLECFNHTTETNSAVIDILALFRRQGTFPDGAEA
jgi:hemolysin-activating ACP:hemolysin acyltransferase